MFSIPKAMGVIWHQPQFWKWIHSKMGKWKMVTNNLTAVIEEALIETFLCAPTVSAQWLCSGVGQMCTLKLNWQQKFQRSAVVCPIWDRNIEEMPIHFLKECQGFCCVRERHRVKEDKIVKSNCCSATQARGRYRRWDTSKTCGRRGCDEWEMWWSRDTQQKSILMMNHKTQCHAKSSLGILSCRVKSTPQIKKQALLTIRTSDLNSVLAAAHHSTKHYSKMSRTKPWKPLLRAIDRGILTRNSSLYHVFDKQL